MEIEIFVFYFIHLLIVAGLVKVKKKKNFCKNDLTFSMELHFPLILEWSIISK